MAFDCSLSLLLDLRYGYRAGIWGPCATTLAHHNVQVHGARLVDRWSASLLGISSRTLCCPCVWDHVLLQIGRSDELEQSAAASVHHHPPEPGQRASVAPRTWMTQLHVELPSGVPACENHDGLRAAGVLLEDLRCLADVVAEDGPALPVRVELRDLLGRDQPEIEVKQSCNSSAHYGQAHTMRTRRWRSRQQRGHRALRAWSNRRRRPPCRFPRSPCR